MWPLSFAPTLSYSPFSLWGRRNSGSKQVPRSGRTAACPLALSPWVTSLPWGWERQLPLHQTPPAPGSPHPLASLLPTLGLPSSALSPSGLPSCPVVSVLSGQLAESSWTWGRRMRGLPFLPLSFLCVRLGWTQDQMFSLIRTDS